MECFNCLCREHTKEKHRYKEDSGFEHIIDVERCDNCGTIIKRYFKG